MAKKARPLYRCADAALVRAAHAELTLPICPDLTGGAPADVERWRRWLRAVWALDVAADPLAHASPALARGVATVCAAQDPDVGQTRRMVLSTLRYLLRLQHRATPFGLFAGVAPARFGGELAVRWGADHRALVRADASWLAKVITRLESSPPLLARLPLITSNLVFPRGNRLVVPYPPRTHGGNGAGAVEVSLRNTPAVQFAVDAARSPIRYTELAEKLAAEFPTTPRATVTRLVTSLVNQRVLISSLHAPSTIVDAFGHLLAELENARAGVIPQVAELVHQLQRIGADLTRHNRAVTATAGRALRVSVAEEMGALNATTRQPLAVDLLVDCSLVLPQQVARETEAAATALARLSPQPFGTAAWRSFHQRFFERYGIGSLVPLRDVTDPDVGLGFPTGYLDAEPEPPAPVSSRDRRLLALAQAAALDGRQEIVLDEQLVERLATGDQTRTQMPPHLELRFRVHASSSATLEGGEFRLEVLGASRGIGTTTGRFLGLLEPPDREHAATVLAQLPASDPDTVAAQLSYAPLAPKDAHVTRAPELLPAVISLGEHHAPSANLIPLDDLVVGCDRRRLYLASLSLGRRLEPTTLHALDLRVHTLPLARFIAEVGRSQTAVVTAFDWGAAAGLPFLPRVRFGRTVLSPACWRLEGGDLPRRGAPWREWEEALTAWCAQRRMPTAVLLTEGDQLLKLDLAQSAHRVLLRARVDSVGHAVLTEAPERDAHGWFDGHAHEIVVPMMAASPARWPSVPPITASRVISRNHGDLPAASRWLLAKLYGHHERQPEILADHLPELLGEWDSPPTWWYMRYRDPESHLRLRIALPDAAGFGPAAQRVGAWAARLRGRGLLRDVQFATSYPEAGRWGTGAVMVAAEEVFAADSRALAVQFAQPSRPRPQALAAANFVAIATAFTGSTETGMAWLITHAKTASSAAASSTALDRLVRAEAVRLADPTDDWAALRAEPGGQAISESWKQRSHAVSRYRARLTEAEGLDLDVVLDSLLHAHHIRAAGIDKDDERVCVRLARAAALAWRARTVGSKR
ncbi:thiopeptide-type bacteriocin biosynthesis protein [Pseudonocardia kunmingensis]|uniref:Thiopeptide-type bacteriocin biosynthesis protein n=2 Tax=Pseudonocardia kunmingensis TaxID=630975 RepID=A0A543CX24_9PSEU|nr:thiopeptide-type bacteriocin biosynthesis protein [Pseudonocardia kunmingensis]